MKCSMGRGGRLRLGSVAKCTIVFQKEELLVGKFKKENADISRDAVIASKECDIKKGSKF
jgi:hypothetical protein